MAKLYYQGHGSYRIATSDGRVLYVDPYAGDGYEMPADVVLVTHQHGDHNKLGLITQKPNCRIITNREALAGGKHNRFAFDGIEIQAVMAKNLFHNPKKCVGYLIYLDGVKIYASGDTSETEQMKEFAALELDYALLCADGKFNMGLKKAAECAALIKAQHNIPVHLAVGKPYSEHRAAWWEKNAPQALIVTPGQEITLVSAQENEYPGAYINEKVLNYVYTCRDELQVTTKRSTYNLIRQNIGLLSLPTGKIVANDPLVCYQNQAFTTTVKPGKYPVSLLVACSSGGDKRVALAEISFSEKKAVSWEMALTHNQNIDTLKPGHFFGYGVDSGTGGFMDEQTAERISENDLDIYDLFQDQFDNTYVHTYSYAIGSIDAGQENELAAFSSGWGDGSYPSYFGKDESGQPCILVTDFCILD